jgi:DNA-binding transcriptional ArsR family regulator
MTEPGRPHSAGLLSPPSDLDALAGLLRELADPVRLAVLHRLATGPAAASELAAELGLAAPRLANHLTRLRAAGLVTVTRSGRHAIYSLPDRRVAAVLAALHELMPARQDGAGSAPGRAADPSLADARTCYDHLAGRLGVALFDHLVAAGAVLDPPAADNSDVTLGPRAAAVFAGLGVDLAVPLPPRRKVATTCLDWTEQRPHLGGALGAAVLDQALRSGWVQPSGGRVLAVTAAGRQHLSG